MTGPCTAFLDNKRIARGAPGELAAALRGREAGVLVFDDATGKVVDLDWRETAVPPPGPAQARKRGRPKLGVVPREVTLLPRHWDWLGQQPGGASQALRRLIDEARKADQGRVTRRAAQDRAYRFMSAMAGDFPHFEQASRLLFAGDAQGLAAITAQWPADVHAYLSQLLQAPEGDTP
ncbi:DUF2239 family protein [Novosphingobium album (ex Hu et al. 2023)]|uniref:DUF2239 family protein n=1 Tax=Novosphingobium album (ex Hu et al. 2023) TaxID=2930093 RepID=A0ABT0B077_9SPHN|nr:DUF2239 family protein [Novosphingobium album (ex Hu et al. 2023)]MCJ2178344.1 DUF2239 family protein [Novosphingobium album (ex Hu et al. 2023)]